MTKPKIEVLFSLPAASARTLEGEITFQVFQVQTGKTLDIAKGVFQSGAPLTPYRLVARDIQDPSEVLFTLLGTNKHQILDDALVYLSSLYTTVDTTVLPHLLVLNSVALGVRPTLKAIRTRLSALNDGFRDIVAATALALHQGSKTVDVPTLGVFTLPPDVCLALQGDQKEEIKKILKRELEEITGYTYSEILQMRKRVPKDSGLEID